MNWAEHFRVLHRLTGNNTWHLAAPGCQMQEVILFDGAPRPWVLNKQWELVHDHELNNEFSYATWELQP